jgi:hypothetical protein
MVLYLIGLGLYDERDITLRGLDAVRGCARVYLEAYTSILLCDKAKLEALYGKDVVVADREMVENEADVILEGAESADVAFLVVGDPFGATTHTDLQLRARERGIEVRVIHNASVMNAVGACGLQLYRFGEAVSIVFFTDTWRPGEGPRLGGRGGRCGVDHGACGRAAPSGGGRRWRQQRPGLGWLAKERASRWQRGRRGHEGATAAAARAGQPREIRCLPASFDAVGTLPGSRHAACEQRAQRSIRARPAPCRQLLR